MIIQLFPATLRLPHCSQWPDIFPDFVIRRLAFGTMLPRTRNGQAFALNGITYRMPEGCVFCGQHNVWVATARNPQQPGFTFVTFDECNGWESLTGATHPARLIQAVREGFTEERILTGVG